MRLAIDHVEQEKTKTLRLVVEDNRVTVLDEDHWCILTFLVNENDNLVFVRAGCVPEDVGIEVDDKGRIVETP
jgi:hypothetical protein